MLCLRQKDYNLNTKLNSHLMMGKLRESFKATTDLVNAIFVMGDWFRKLNKYEVGNSKIRNDVRQTISSNVGRRNWTN